MNSQLDIRHDQSLRALNTFGIDAKAYAYVQVCGVEHLRVVRDDPALSALRRLVLGGGSNLLLTRDFDGLVLHMSNKGIVVSGDNESSVYVTAQAGENWHGFVQWTLAQGYPGLENLSLIPGSVGASPIQNIGAYGAELAEYFHSLKAFDFQTGDVIELSRADCCFAYRDSIFKHELSERAVILDVTFALPKRWQPNLRYAELATELEVRAISQPTAKDISEAVIAIRSRKLPDPTKIGNAGSFFKNPTVSRERYEQLLIEHPQLVSYPQTDGSVKLAAGWLIDQCGWKGKSLGPAGVHDKQALVLVNLGDATGSQLMNLASRIQEDVKERFDVVLEPEPIVI
jgi:UDP-N-acetylmuramate dehydrogenase